jgi:large subunit ribosomal protein L17e|mmetsp:Transcript_77003/g.112742  ORF Transcript_77003/g.112742 Transcript_77003/m.112742 type:complete len:167 (+) Transcript_77003:770-1270(+)
MTNKNNDKNLVEKSCNAKGSNLRVHFKNTRETSAALKGMSLKRAQQFLKNVITKVEIVPFTRFKYGVSRKSQLKTMKKSSTGRWPKKSATILLEILKNAESNASEKGLDVNAIFIDKVNVNKAIKGRRRTFRAHGRINNFNSNPCHVRVSLIQRNNSIPKCFTKNN